MTAEQIKALLRLDPHPIEGGHFRQTWAAPGTLDLPQGRRSPGTAIYYLLEKGQFSEMHMLDSDEMFHFYLGDPVEMLQLFPDGRSAVLTLGQDLSAGQLGAGVSSGWSVAGNEADRGRQHCPAWVHGCAGVRICRLSQC